MGDLYQLEKDIYRLGHLINDWEENTVKPLLVNPMIDKLRGKNGVYFLGTAGSMPAFIFHTIDHLRRFTDDNNHFLRAVAGFFVELDGTRILIDPGPHFTEQIRSSKLALRRRETVPLGSRGQAYRRCRSGFPCRNRRIAIQFGRIF